MIFFVKCIVNFMVVGFEAMYYGLLLSFGLSVQWKHIVHLLYFALIDFLQTFRDYCMYTCSCCNTLFRNLQNYKIGLQRAESVVLVKLVTHFSYYNLITSHQGLSLSITWGCAELLYGFVPWESSPVPRKN